MKAQDLMIGDWVYYSHTEDGIAPFDEVTQIEADDFTRDECIFQTLYQPIPLTPKILEKNGFENIDKTTSIYTQIIDDYAIEIRLYEEPILRVGRKRNEKYQQGKSVRKYPDSPVRFQTYWKYDFDYEYADLKSMLGVKQEEE